MRCRCRSDIAFPDLLTQSSTRPYSTIDSGLVFLSSKSHQVTTQQRKLCFPSSTSPNTISTNQRLQFVNSTRPSSSGSRLLTLSSNIAARSSDHMPKSRRLCNSDVRLVRCAKHYQTVTWAKSEGRVKHSPATNPQAMSPVKLISSNATLFLRPTQICKHRYL